MALVWQCDRCYVSSRNGNIDDPPEGWVFRAMPVRGSEGARSSMDVTLCSSCDDSLYEWLHEQRTTPLSSSDDSTRRRTVADPREVDGYVLPAYIGWANAERDRASLRLYATDHDDSPRWDAEHIGGRVVEYSVLDRGQWGEGDRVLVVRAGNRFLSDEAFERISAACQAAVEAEHKSREATDG